MGHTLGLQLFDGLKPELTSFYYRMLGSIDDADDAVQETFWPSIHDMTKYRGGNRK
ncbi:sigma factor [Paenibacillus solanacearum]|nr:sigma factor [Paenibacillus solanacearum]